MCSYVPVRFCKVCLLILLVSGIKSLPTAMAQQNAAIANEAATRLLAGAATANITPPLGELIVGGFDPLPADDVHDELHVRAIVLAEVSADSVKQAPTSISTQRAFDPKRTIGFVVCDNVGISREVFDEAKDLLQKETGLLPSNILMAATHTHSATSARTPNAMVRTKTMSEYQTFLSRRIADAVRMALRRLAPAKVAWGAVDEPSQLFNRRWYVVEEKERRNPFGGVDTVRMNPGKSTLVRPAGPIDPQVSFLSVQHIDGRPMALLANYSLHYVGGVPARTISADYFAVFANRMTELLTPKGNDTHPPFVGILSNGTSGDVNNINFQQRGPSLPNFEKMRIVGNLIAERVYGAMSELKYADSLRLDARSSELTLGVRKPTQEMLEYAEKVLAKKPEEEKFHARERDYAERIKLQAKAGDTVDIVLQTLRIGDLAITAIPFEVFTETGLEIKQKSPWPRTFTMELANGSYGYLPTPPQHALGGYETWLGTNKVEVEASTKIVARLLEMLSDMKK